MKRNIVTEKSYWWIVLFVVIGFSSCKTARVATTSPGLLKPMSTSKLIRNVESNVFDYKYLSIKKIVCQFDNGKTKTSFRANIQAEKDKQITVMLTKLNIPVGRLWLTPDSVKFINYLEENYFLDDYSYLSSLMDLNLDFEMVNSIISNNVFSFREKQHDNDNQNYLNSIENGMYVLESVVKPQTKKINSRIQDRKPGRHSKKLVEDAPVSQKLYIDAVNFKLRKIVLLDAVNTRSVNVDFSNFIEVGKQQYPSEISLQLQSPDSKMHMDIKLSNFSMEEERGVRFKVPERFTQIGHE